MYDDLHIPIVQEEAHVLKRSVDTERVSVRTSTEQMPVIVRDELRHDHVEVTRLPIGRDVDEAPLVRTEGDVTIVPVIEERLIVAKQLFLVEEVHLRRTVSSEPVELPTTLRRTRVDIDRTAIDSQEEQ